MKLIWHDRPDEAVRAKATQLHEVRLTKGEKAYWDLTREVLKTDPWYLMRVAFQWGWLDEDLVGRELIRHIAEDSGKDKAILFPRGHGKTLPMAAIVIIHILNDPDIAILEISRTDDNAEKFGSMVSELLLGNDYIQRCFGTAHNKNGFIPSSISECKQWGKDGYSLPNRRPRLDPTLHCISIKSAKAGKHPDWIYLDDLTEKENNDTKGWEHVKEIVNGCKMMVPADGYFVWTATRWHDADPMGMVKRGKLKGKQGAFKVIQYSCYVDDKVANLPTYPRKKRWNMEKETGYTHSMLEEMRAPEELGGMGEFFDAQMRNDPAPLERADIKVKDINIFTEETEPKFSNVRLMGIETTGGGLVAYNGFREHLDSLRLSLPITEISNPRKLGTTKRDRIVAALQPIVDRGGLYCRDWMLGDDNSTDTLGYELRRLGKATHDDIADSLHNVPVHLAKGIRPAHESDPADLYISVDLAWSEEKRADYTVAMAVAVDFRGNYYVLDYDRFQVSSPTGLYTRLLAFYQKFEGSTHKSSRRKGKFPGAWK